MGQGPSSLTEILELAPWTEQIVKFPHLSRTFLSNTDLYKSFQSELSRVWAEEMAQQLRVLTALSEALSSVPSTHIEGLTTVCTINSLSKGLDTSGPCQHLNSRVHTQADTHLHIIKTKMSVIPRLGPGPFVPVPTQWFPYPVVTDSQKHSFTSTKREVLKHV